MKPRKTITAKEAYITSLWVVAQVVVNQLKKKRKR